MSNSTEIKGTVETCLPLETFASGFSKRVLIVNTGGDYPQMIPIEFTKEKADLLTGLRKGQEVTAHVNLRGNEYNGKYYANIQGWKLDKGGVGQSPQPDAHNKAKANAYQPEPEDDRDDFIPF
jgi:hypothetical protein